MCGINGIVSTNRTDYHSTHWYRSKLERMNNQIIHRGPDSGGIYTEQNVGFGFRRLSIIDLSDHANQPMVNTDRNVVLIFNGEIYNYIEIRQSLEKKGHVFKTTSDTEVIITSYLEYGEECVHQFNGMWAFALYDFINHKLFCSRDRLGVKPFYYIENQGHLFFSSELKALHSVLKLNEANLAKTYEYLAYGYRVNDGETFLKGVNELQPGSNLILDQSGLHTHKYWTLKPDLFDHQGSFDYHTTYTSLFEDAVRLRYRSDVPVALLLSGGLDSSAIGKVTDNLIQNGRLGQSEVQAYIASFPGYQHDETAIAREFVKTCKGIKLHEMHIETGKVTQSLAKTIYGLDHPVFSFSTIAHNNIMTACKERGIKVILNGQGSDEAFAGYDRYNAGAYLINQLQKSPHRFIEEFRALNKKNGWSCQYLALQILKSISSQTRTAFYRAKFQEKSIRHLNPEFVKRNYHHYKPTYKFSPGQDNFSNYLLYSINQQGLNHILHYEDVSSMNQSIEVRSPFMDYRLMEFAFSIPPELKMKEGVTKLIQRETIGKMLPDIITSNRNKVGFKTPFNKYLQEDPEFKKMTNDLINSNSFRQKNIWNSDSLFREFKKEKVNENFPFWRIINLEIWSQVYSISNL
ncbi:MAG: asparagine synthase (glutamine-hydrolyzing) [Saprospiraceae bacterium]|nr:asparagine synthase (glutamine-hydrolyzing) [Saprospiraceae bacterium]